MPDPADDPFWQGFWSAKLAVMGREGVHVFARPLRYRNRTVHLPGGSTHTFLTGEEKGIDVRLALDVIRLAHRGEYDVALVFSQDQDLSEVAQEIRVIAAEQNRWIKIACAFPASPTSRKRRGIDRTDWVRLDREAYSNPGRTRHPEGLNQGGSTQATADARSGSQDLVCGSMNLATMTRTRRSGPRRPKGPG